MFYLLFIAFILYIDPIRCKVKFLVLNDIHLAPNLTEHLNCYWGNCTDLGLKNVGKDTPISLLEFVYD